MTEVRVKNLLSSLVRSNTCNGAVCILPTAVVVPNLLDSIFCSAGATRGAQGRTTTRRPTLLHGFYILSLSPCPIQ